VATSYGGDVGVGAVCGGTEGGGGEGGGGRLHQRRGCFPGPHRINRPDMEEHCSVIFGLVAESGGHREIATRSARAVAAWQKVFDIYFNPISGAGRAFTMWTNRRDDLNKFRKAVLGALEFHAAAFDLGESPPTQVQIRANDLRVERNNTIAAHDAAVAQREQHQGILLAANRGMGLVPLGRGVLPPPNLGFAINRNQELALSELAHRTQSVDSTRGGVSLGGSNGNRSNSISLESLDDEDHIEIEFVGNLPAGLAAATPTPTAHTPALHTPAPVTAAGGINLGVIAGNQAGQRAQANIAAGNIGNPQVFPSGVRTSRNLDQVTLI